MYYVLKGLAWLLGFARPSTLEKIAHFITIVTFRIFGLRKKIILDNLAIAFPNLSLSERIRIAYLSQYNFALTILEFLATAPGKIADQVTIEDGDLLKSCLAENKGAYILCFHMGNWEAMAAAMTKNLVKSHVVVKKIALGGVDRFLDERRLANGFYPIRKQKKGDGFIAIKEALSRGEAVGFVMDQARTASPLLPFFGRPAKTNVAFAAIWRRLPAPIVPAYIVRSRACEHRLHFFPPVTLQVTDNAEADILAHSALFNLTIENLVRQHPEQYFWAHRRWK